MPCPNCHKSPEPKKRRMSASSAKAKGRRLQQRVRDDMRTVAGTRLDITDIESTPMGCNGVDVILTKAARDFFGDLAIECKNVEILNAVGVFQGHLEKYQPKGKIPVMVHARNHIEPRVTMLWTDFVRLYLKPVADITSFHPRSAAKHSSFAVDEGLEPRAVPGCESCAGPGPCPFHTMEGRRTLKPDTSGQHTRSVTGNSYGLGGDD